MTPLTRAVRRVTGYKHRGRHLVVSLLPGDVLELRQLRTRQTYCLPLAAAYDMAVRAAVDAKRRAKAEARKANKR